MTDWVDAFNNNLKNKLRDLGPYAIPNAAARAYVYNALGVPQMTNRDFRPDEIAQAKEAWRNAQAEQGGRQVKPIAVTPDNYKGKVAETTGIVKPLKNAIQNPMRMTLGSMYVSPEGRVLNTKGGNYYYGDVYDFSPNVQTDPDFAKYYQALQDFGTRVRNNVPPMLIDLNLKDNQ